MGCPVMAQWKGIQLGTRKLWVRSLASLSGLGIQSCCELWCRSQKRLLWLWRKPAATALTRPLAWNLCMPLVWPSKDKRQKKKKRRKKKVVHIYNGILLSHKKEQNNAICSNIDGTRDSHTK